MIELSIEGRVARLHIRRAEKKNAITEAMWRHLSSCCEQLNAACMSNDPNAPRVLLLQGEPGAFCAGADIEELSRVVLNPEAMAANLAVVAQAQLALENLPLPTLAVIDGPCFGGGFGLAAACDFRVASVRASFAITPAKLGLLYSLEDTRRVLRLVGDARTRRLLLQSETLDATTALAWGVVDSLHEADALAAAAMQRAQALAQASRTSMAGIKATLACLSTPSTSQETAVRQAFAAAFQGADFAEGAKAFLQRRAPRF